MEVAARQPIATDIKLPRHANGHRAELAV
jgi:hypothetical protein